MSVNWTVQSKQVVLGRLVTVNLLRKMTFWHSILPVKSYSFKTCLWRFHALLGNEIIELIVTKLIRPLKQKVCRFPIFSTNHRYRVCKFGARAYLLLLPNKIMTIVFWFVWRTIKPDYRISKLTLLLLIFNAFCLNTKTT